MSLQADCQKAAVVLQQIHERLRVNGDRSLDAELAAVRAMLESPLFKQVLVIQESLDSLKEAARNQSLKAEHFDILPLSGQLVFSDSIERKLNMAAAARRASTIAAPGVGGRHSKTHSMASGGSGDTGTAEQAQHSRSSSTRHDEAFRLAIGMLANGRQLEVVQLYKAENVGLGFSVVGLKVENRNEPGIYVQDIQPSGVAAQDGRLQEGDQLLSIDGLLLDDKVSQRQAVSALQQSKGLVELVVAHGPISISSGSSSSNRLTPSSAFLSVPSLVSASFGDHATVGLGSTAGGGSSLISGILPGQAASESTSDMITTEWTQLQVIELVNDGSGLGFGIIGGRSTGVVVKTVLPGGVADRDGRLQAGDHLLQIGSVNVRGLGSEQVAAVLRQAGSHVRLVVARPVQDMAAVEESHPSTVIVPTDQIDSHLQALYAPEPEQQLEMQDASSGGTAAVPLLRVTVATLSETAQVAMAASSTASYKNDEDRVIANSMLPESEIFEVELVKDVGQGLGITIAGYVGDGRPYADSSVISANDDLSGIFVKSITPGGAAALSGKVVVNDHIVEVDGQAMLGRSNHEAVAMLRNTGQRVLLKLVRYHHGPSWERLQVYAGHAESEGKDTLASIAKSEAVTQNVAATGPSFDDEEYAGQLTAELEAAIKQQWQMVIGSHQEVVVAQLCKFSEGGGLGISLEGTVDVERGVQTRPHHYIRSILPDGPVGRNGCLESGDELLQVNDHKLLGMNHRDVVAILKELPQHVRIVCARQRQPAGAVRGSSSSVQNMAGVASAEEQTVPVQALLPPSSSLLMARAKSEQIISEYSTGAARPAATDNGGKPKARSLDPLTSYTHWESEIVTIELIKGDRGLGFSILDYQDPVFMNRSIIVISGLVPGGVAAQNGQLAPGDRLLFVNDLDLENATLDQAVQTLKFAPQGMVRIGIVKPLPLFDSDGGSVGSGGGESESDVQVSKLDKAALMASASLPVGRMTTTVAVNGRSDSTLSTSDADGNMWAAAEIKEKAVTATALSVGQYESQLRSKSADVHGPIGAISLPSALERLIKLKKGDDQIGVTLDSVDDGINGCLVKQVKDGSAIAKDGRIRAGDYLVAINGESLRHASSAQARSILRRAALLGTDISMRYIPAEDAIVHRDTVKLVSASNQASGVSGESTSQQQPSVRAQPAASPSTSKEPAAAPAAVGEHASAPAAVAPSQTSSIAAANQLQKVWAEPHVVVLERKPLTSLGINIVGGRLDTLTGLSDHAMTGILVKSIVPGSTADQCGSLNVGDLILEVNGIDIGSATHDRAVELLRSADSPVKLLVQSLISSSSEVAAAVARAINSAQPAQGHRQSWSSTAMLAQADDDDSTHSGSEESDEFGYTWSRLEKKYSDLDGELIVVELRAGDTVSREIGIELVGCGNAGIRVASLTPGSAAAKDGCIFVGDRLLEINGHELEGTDEHAADIASKMLKSMAAPYVTLILFRDDNGKPFLDGRSMNPFAVGAGIGGSAFHSDQHVDKQPLGAADSQRVIVLDKGSSPSLGFGITQDILDVAADDSDGSASGIFVNSIAPKGIAATTSDLTIGDELLYVNGNPLRNMSYKEVLDMLRSTKGKVTIVITRHRKVLSEPQLAAVKSNGSLASLKSLPTALDGAATIGRAEEIVSSDETLPRIVPGQETLIVLKKGNQNLGISILGGADTPLHSVIVQEVYASGAAARDGRLQSGDYLLEVNGIDLRDTSHENATQLLRQTKDPINLLVYREEGPNDGGSIDDNESASSSDDHGMLPSGSLDSSLYVTRKIELNKPPGSSLGLSLVGRKNGAGGIFVADIVPGGMAAHDGRLRQGDYILTINGKDMRAATQAAAVNMIKGLQGMIQLSVGRIRTDSQSSASGSVGSFDFQNTSSSVPAVEDQTLHDYDNEPHQDSSLPIRTVVLTKNQDGAFGIKIAGGREPGGVISQPLTIVYSDQAAAQPVKAGDVIHSINGVSSDKITRSEAIDLLREAKSSVTLEVVSIDDLALDLSQLDDGSDEEFGEPTGSDMSEDGKESSSAAESGSVPAVSVVNLQKGPDGLGFSIVGGYGSPHGDLPIYIKSVFDKGAAASDGRLVRGDRLLAVNGQSLDGVSHDKAVAILKAASGTVYLTVSK